MCDPKQKIMRCNKNHLIIYSVVLTSTRAVITFPMKNQFIGLKQVRRIWSDNFLVSMNYSHFIVNWRSRPESFFKFNRIKLSFKSLSNSCCIHTENYINIVWLDDCSINKTLKLYVRLMKLNLISLIKMYADRNWGLWIEFYLIQLYLLNWARHESGKYNHNDIKYTINTDPYIPLIQT